MKYKQLQQQKSTGNKCEGPKMQAYCTLSEGQRV